MAKVLQQRSKYITHILNGTIASIKTVIPLQGEIKKPTLLKDQLHLNFGVLIGITGDMKGKLILCGEMNVFSAIGEAMFGMAVENDMIASFSGELGNMIAGSLSTNIVEQGIETDITHPTILQGNTKLSGYEQAIQLPTVFPDIGEIIIYFLLD